MASPVPAPTQICFDAFELYTASGELRKAGILLKLQPQPFRVLLLLIERAGQSLRVKKFSGIFGPIPRSSISTTELISQSTRSAPPSQTAPKILAMSKTLPKRGYRFIGVVQQPSALKESATAGADLDACNQTTKEVPVMPGRLRRSGSASNGGGVLWAERRQMARPPVGPSLSGVNPIA
jgi:hypothetical protein